MPTNFTGALVTISVLGSNGNYRTIGTATTDTSGAYNLAWAPDISGNFTIYANFGGTKSYWPSSAESRFYVENAQPTAAPTATPISMASTQSDIMYIGAAMISVVIIGIIVLAMLITRKHA